jgi:hypothetical protein
MVSFEKHVYLESVIGGAKEGEEARKNNMYLLCSLDNQKGWWG